MIYATQYKQSTKQCITASIDSGFASLQQVVDTFGGENCNTEHPRMVLHGDSEERVAFSDFIFVVDEPDTIE